MTLDYDILLNRMFFNADKNGTPLAGSFELTSRCPLDCKMCYIHKRENDRDAISREKDTAWWLKLIDKAKERGLFTVLLTGGEPLLRQDFDEIYLACKKAGMVVSVNTNGVLIDDKKIELFKNHPPSRLNITLYGASEETYEALCGDRKAFDKVMTALKKLRDAEIPVKLNFSVTPQNSGDCERVQSFAKEYGYKIQPVTYMYPPVRCSGKPVRLPPGEAAKEHFLWQRRLLGDENMLKYALGKEDYSPPTDISDCGEKIKCRAGLSTFWVTYDGEMRPCGMMNVPTVRISDFDEAWEEIRSARENIILPKECKTCPYVKICDVCAAVTLAETGEFHGVPEYACKKAQEYSRLCKNFIEEMICKDSGFQEVKSNENK